MFCVCWRIMFHIYRIKENLYKMYCKSRLNYMLTTSLLLNTQQLLPNTPETNEVFFFVFCFFYQIITFFFFGIMKLSKVIHRYNKPWLPLRRVKNREFTNNFVLNSTTTHNLDHLSQNIIK